MGKEKETGDREKTFQESGESCSRNYKPWIWSLVIMALLTIAWAMYEGYKKEEDIQGDFLKRFLGYKGSDKTQSSAMGGIEPAKGLQNSYHSIIEIVRPAVVSIDAAVQDMQGAANQAGTAAGNLDFVAGEPAVRYNRVGSGAIIDPGGFVLSSYHVIAGAVSLKATVYGQGGAVEYPLKVVKADRGTDMALLRIQGDRQFPYAILGDSNSIRTGDVIISIGSPFGFDQTVTSGIISSRNRSVIIGGTIYENLIQTDSPINKGSSGGPLINTKGEVIGINTAIYSPDGSFAGIGFSIPINNAAELIGGVLDFKNLSPQVAGGQVAAWTKSGRQSGNAFKLPDGQMITAPHPYRGKCVDCHPQLQNAITFNPDFMGQKVAGQKVANVEPFLGITLVEVDEVIARQFNMINPQGVLVNSVLPGTPAEVSGIQRGDIITRIGGKKIQDMKGFRKLIAERQAGKRFELVILRNGSRQTVDIKTSMQPPFLPPTMLAAQKIAEFEWLEAEFTPLPPAIMPYEKTGVYVVEVEGILAAAGVKAGDIIKEVDKNPIPDMGSFVKITKNLNAKKGFLLDIVRAGTPIYITVKG